jgi:hypothetical protein
MQSNQKLLTGFRQIGLTIGVLALAFAISWGLNEVLFLADSPRVRPNITSHAWQQIAGVSGIGEPIADSVKQFGEVAAEPVFRGVYAGQTDDGLQTTVITIDEVEWITYEYEGDDGSITTIRMPRGESPPPGVSADQIPLEID